MNGIGHRAVPLLIAQSEQWSLRLAGAALVTLGLFVLGRILVMGLRRHPQEALYCAFKVRH